MPKAPTSHERPWTHTHKVLNTAADLLKKFTNSDPLLDRQVTFGTCRKLREGERRQITYLQVEDAILSDLELRIEVFVVKKGER